MIQKPYAPYDTDERLVKPYLLPDPLQNSDGTRIRTAQEWMNSRRTELLNLFKREEYGEILPRPAGMSFRVLSEKDNALEKTAIRKEIQLDFVSSNGNKHSIILLLYLPKDIRAPVPTFLGLNFNGNHTTTEEPDVIPTGFRTPGHLAEEKRGTQTDCWCFRDIIRRGYASATLCYHDLFPDIAGSISRSVFRLFRRRNAVFNACRNRFGNHFCRPQIVGHRRKCRNFFGSKSGNAQSSKNVRLSQSRRQSSVFGHSVFK